MQLNIAAREAIIAECRSAMSRYGYDDAQTEQFCSLASDYLSDYIEQADDGRDITYAIRKRIDRVELKMSITGERNDPFTHVEKASERRLSKAIGEVLRNQEATASYHYRLGSNIIVIRSARKDWQGSVLRQPTVLAVVLGVLAGVACRHLPRDVSDFIIYEVASPVLSVILNMLTGIMGPIIFLSLVMSISSLESINELTQLGGTVIKRFVRSVLAITVISILIGLLFFPVLGEGSINLDASAAIGLLLDVIPTNIVTPFVENNLPQLVVLGAACGASLLLLGERGAPIKDVVTSLNEWTNVLMDLVMKALPAIPFLSVFKMIANGETEILIEGWKFIVATYACIAACITLKFVKATVRSGVGMTTVWRSMRPLVNTVFVTSSGSAAMKMNYEVSEELGIDSSFSSFWVPLAYGMLLPSTTVGFVLSTLFIADVTGTPVTPSFLLVLVILTVQLSLASPGLTPGTTVIVQSLGMPADYVGAFSAYRIFTKNAAAAFNTAYRMLEQLEAASVTGNLGTPDKDAPHDEGVAR